VLVAAVVVLLLLIARLVKQGDAVATPDAASGV
jgi:hypothetical protein